MQRGQCHPAFCSCQFSYPLPFRGQVCKTQSSLPCCPSAVLSSRRPPFVSSSLNFPENHRFDFAIAAVARDRSIECSEMATERACVGRLISSIKTGQGIGLSDDASSQGRTSFRSKRADILGSRQSQRR